MPRSRQDFGFPRWGGYGKEQEATTVRLCDAEGCSEKADHPARKSPHSNERWWFCEVHAADYNRNWDFFRGMSEEEAVRFQADESRTRHAKADSWGWEGPEKDGLTRAERDAWEVLDLEPGTDPQEVKARYRSMAKTYHPDRNPGDKEAEQQFHRIQAAYDFLVARFT